jgi:hypothetical protein
MHLWLGEIMVFDQIAVFFLNSFTACRGLEWSLRPTTDFSAIVEPSLPV